MPQKKYENKVTEKFQNNFYDIEKKGGLLQISICVVCYTGKNSHIPML